jgi:hypothetical protein
MTMSAMPIPASRPAGSIPDDVSGSTSVVLGPVGRPELPLRTSLSGELDGAALGLEGWSVSAGASLGSSLGSVEG